MQFAKFKDRVCLKSLVMEVSCDLLMIGAGLVIGSYLKNMML